MKESCLFHVLNGLGNTELEIKKQSRSKSAVENPQKSGLKNFENIIIEGKGKKHCQTRLATNSLPLI